MPLGSKMVPPWGSLQESSESEEIDSYSCNDCKKTVYTNDTHVQCDFCDHVYGFPCSEISTKTKKDAIQEQKEVDIRKLSIMCFGLAESTEESQVMRTVDEIANLKHIIYDVLEVSEEDFPMDDIKPVRIGQIKENKIRPIRFEAKSVAGKKKVLQMARIKLKESTDHEYKNLFFKPDLTKKQRAEALGKKRK